MNTNNETTADNAPKAAAPKDADSVKGRLLQFMHVKNISQATLTRQLEVSGAYINAIRKSIPEEKVRRLCELYPDLNRDWLLFGDGEMLLEARKRTTDAYEVPLLPVEAFAGSLQHWSHGVTSADCEKVLISVPGVELAIRLSSDSMEPELHDGSILFIKRINSRTFIPWGNPMVIDTENGVLVKALFPIPDDAVCVEARSFNPNYPPIQIPMDSIYGLYRVLAVTKHYATM